MRSRKIIAKHLDTAAHNPSATTATSPSPAKGWTDPIPGPRVELVRAILATLSAAERRTVYTDLRDFLRVLHGAYLAGEFARGVVRAMFDDGSAEGCRKGSAEAADTIANALECTPHRTPLAALCSAVMGADLMNLTRRIGEDDGADEARRVRRALRILRAEYSDLRGSARAATTTAVAGGAL